jgi:hypothetical protein
MRSTGGRAFKKGGKVSYPIDDGAGGGEGRMEKAKAYGSKSNIKEPGVKA